MHIATLGSGPDLVLIHGWAMHGGVFAPLSERLSTRFRLHLVDLPGHGASRDDVTSLDPPTCAAALAARLPRAVWIGWSLGGLVALTLALDHAERARGVVAIASSPRFVRAADWPHGVSPELLAEFGDGLCRDYRGTIDRFLALEALGADRSQAELRTLKARVFERGEPTVAALQEGLRVLGAQDLRARLSQLPVPSLWLAGRRDRLVPSGALRFATQQCADARFIETPGGHVPFLAHAAEVAEAIVGFVASLPP
jgi:pimeloyl-[acyl-carrier protein] methyl ester esterase